MLKGVGSGYEYAGVHYDTFRDGLVAMLHDVTWRGGKVEFADIDALSLSDVDKSQYLLLMAMFQWDIVTMLESASYKDYAKYAGDTIPNGKQLLANSPLWGMKLTMPATYQGNYVMQSAMLPAMDTVYDKWNRSVQCKNGKYPFKQVISLLADQILFNPKTSPFVEAMEMYKTLDSHEHTRSLCDYIHNEDMPKARILSMQVKTGDLKTTDFISIGSLRKARYECGTKDLWGDASYMDTMLSLAPSMQSDDYFTWLTHAGQVAGKDIGNAVEDWRRNYEGYKRQMGDLNLEQPAEEPASKKKSVAEKPVVEEKPKRKPRAKKATEAPTPPTEEKKPRTRKKAEPTEEKPKRQPRTKKTADTPDNTEVKPRAKRLTKAAIKRLVESVLGFAADDAILATIPQEIKKNLKPDMEVDFSTATKIRQWYVQATTPKKTPREVVEQALEMTLTNEMFEAVPDKFKLDTDLPHDLVDELVDWWIAYTTPKPEPEPTPVQAPEPVQAPIPEPEPAPEPVTPPEPKPTPVQEQKPVNYGPMKSAAREYCSYFELTLEEVASGLNSEGYNGEAMYRALTRYIMSKGKDVNISRMVAYLYALHDVYGSTYTRYEKG